MHLLFRVYELTFTYREREREREEKRERERKYLALREKLVYDVSVLLSLSCYTIDEIRPTNITLFAPH